MKQSKNRVLEAINSLGEGLAVEFLRRAARWGHTIAAVAGNQSWPILESIEGEDSQLFPPSPPLQHVVFENRPDHTQVAMSVGMAGRGHWSVCVEAFPSTVTVRMDVACRCPQGGEDQLTSRYRLLTPWQQGPQGALLFTETKDFHCDLRAVVVGSARTTLRLQEHELTIGPTWNTDQPTQRWCYELKLKPLNPRP